MIKPIIKFDVSRGILDTNVPARSAERLVKCTPGGRCLYNRHVAAIRTLVLEGDLHLFEPTASGRRTR
jgi:hypothetical protein